jgi:hypothetical protein
MPAPKPVKEVLLNRDETEPPTTHDRLGRPLVGPCLIWRGKIPKDGYVRITNREFKTKSPQLLHRVAYGVAHGIPLAEVPPELDHLCHVPAWTTAPHLEPVTRKENLLRGDGNQNLNKTECDQGHPFDAANTIHRKGGGRACRACKNVADRESWRRKNRPDLVGQPAMSYSEAAKLAAHPWGFEQAR